jgi:hypothetical protein
VNGALGLLLLSFSFLATCSGAPVELNAVPICEVLRHIPNYTDKFLTLRGAVVQYEHGAYLVPTTRCGGDELGGIRFESGALPNLSDKGVRHPAVVEGKLSISYRRLPRSTQASHPVFVARRIQLEEGPTKNPARRR